MKKLLLGLISVLCMLYAREGTAQVVDDFPGSTLSANWTVVTGAFQVSSGYAGPNNNSVGSYAYYNAYTPPADQDVCITAGVVSNGGFGIAARSDATGQNNYELNFYNGTVQLYKTVGGTATQFGTWGTATAGHIYCITAVGTKISATDNGTLIPGASVTDSSIASGGVGIFGYGSSENGTHFTASPHSTTPTAAAPTFSPAGGSYSSTVSVTLASTTSGTSIYYTLDGSTPTTSSTPYTAPISVSTTTTIKTLATEAGYNPSVVSSATYTITGIRTWYIRADGGTRYSANVTTGQCDGLGDVSYASTGGTGVNQHCAFKDYRYLWDDQSYGNNAWVISGGDTVIIRNGPWRIGFNQGASANDAWCVGGNGPFACVNPQVPSGTSSQPTQILGENYASCYNGTITDRTKLTQLFGGFGAGVVLNLSSTQYVKVACLEITRHSQCITHGSPVYPSGCSKSYPLDDYDSDGVTTSGTTANVTLTDMWIHGHTDRGIIGPIGGVVTCLRCNISYNGMAGWDFDDGSGVNSKFGAGSIWNFNYSQIEWNGCNQEYPMVSTFPAISCYGQGSGGYGDGVGTPAGTGTGMTVNVDHSTFDYNTQDGIDLGHMDAGTNTLTFTNNLSYANSGGQYKWGAYFQNAVIKNNIAVANCMRMGSAIIGAPSTFNTNLGDFCRAQDAISFNFLNNATAELENNTTITYAPTTYDMNCWDTNGCANATLTFKNNITIAYDNPATYGLGGQAGGPGGFYYQATIGNIVRSNNYYYGLRNITCPTGFPNEYCVSPQLVNQPTTQGANFVETQLDNYSFHLTAGSPVIGAGLNLGIPQDFYGLTRPSPPSIGAVEYAAAPARLFRFLPIGIKR